MKENNTTKTKPTTFRFVREEKMYFDYTVVIDVPEGTEITEDNITSFDWEILGYNPQLDYATPTSGEVEDLAKI